MRYNFYKSNGEFYFLNLFNDKEAQVKGRNELTVVKVTRAYANGEEALVHRKKVYLAGKITGLEREYIWQKFDMAEKFLSDLGYEVINPLRINGINTLEEYLSHEPMEHHEYLRKDLRELLSCDIVYMMEDWFTSYGCSIEIDLANKVKIPILMIRSLGFIQQKQQ